MALPINSLDCNDTDESIWLRLGMYLNLRSPYCTCPCHRTCWDILGMALGHTHISDERRPDRPCVVPRRIGRYIAWGAMDLHTLVLIPGIFWGIYPPESVNPPRKKIKKQYFLHNNVNPPPDMWSPSHNTESRIHTVHSQTQMISPHPLTSMIPWQPNRQLYSIISNSGCTCMSLYPAVKYAML